MINISEKEYEQLKIELASIKACITRYISFIISVAGLGSLLAKFIADSQDVIEYSIVVVIISVIIITLLFEVIWYKFISHNRYVGYIQLISQEVGYHELNEEYRKDRNSKPYLFKNTEHKRIDKISSIYTWEYMMSRYNNSKRKRGDDVDKKIVRSASDTYFDFQIPYQYNAHKDEIYEHHADYHFFSKVINPLYARNPQRRFNLNFVFQSLKSLLYLYWHSKDYKFRLDNQKIDEKYIVNGWAYPRKVLQITYIAVTVLLIYGGLMLPLTNFCFKEDLRFYNFLSEYKILVYASLVLIINWFWFRKYINKLSDLLNGSHSIDGFCWSFFHFRVQYLNSKNLIPVYFCRGFLRYFKSYLYIIQSRKNFQEIDFKQNACNRCGKNHHDCKCNNAGCSICNPPIESVKFVKQTDETVHCRRCRREYEKYLFEAWPLTDRLKKIHKIVKGTLPSKMTIKSILDNNEMEPKPVEKP